MKKLLILLAAALLLAACSTSKQTLPFARQGKYGKNPVQKNKPIKQSTAWTYRQWGHEGR